MQETQFKMASVIEFTSTCKWKVQMLDGFSLIQGLYDKTRVGFLSTILATSRVVSLVMAFPGFVSLQHSEQKQGWLWEGLSEDGGAFFPRPQQTF